MPTYINYNGSWDSWNMCDMHIIKCVWCSEKYVKVLELPVNLT